MADIRPATDADWPGIWPFLHDIVRAGDTYTWSTDTTEEDARALWLLPPWRVFVAVASDGAIAGSSKIGPNQDGPGAHVANASFIVAASHGGTGVGRALGQHALRFARDAGYRAMQFNAVVETNRRAVALWQSLGFDILTTIPEAFLHLTEGYVGLHVMYLDLVDR